MTINGVAGVIDEKNKSAISGKENVLLVIS